ncbi:serine/threonine kinase-like domain-containing protein STKLD1 isoform X2 [Falco rusticolus]|uniref:serine/threonine kinase-like domain-containing protein STKLD1 isoform X2 n=1 Tax=Falco cherrug TaxID=345164 RepID=UPI0018867EFC|nr:serine/threonine kinase-like domain-containing protein STKLD1 isoform X2 [Falco cherrug]XP_037256439.1 serine/threonine kinase-like domain-containing protein STKLD1 isoform X2 [Falco rusticolus]
MGAASSSRREMMGVSREGQGLWPFSRGAGGKCCVESIWGGRGPWCCYLELGGCISVAPVLQVLEQLQPGALGTAVVAELKTEKSAEKKYIIKQVECIEEKRANEALKEAMDLLKLHHPNICTYKELFVTWDNEISSLFLCLVMQYSGQGDLSSVIKEKRQKSEKITDVVILKFLGQMVDALFYIHKQNIFHRNLKPSNILVIGEASFMLSDFSTETLMTDELKWKIRVEENSKSWMAPETFHFSFTEKSDIWSLGCILLDMSTCFVLNAEEITSLLQDIRRDTGRLEGVLTLMQNGDNSSSPLFPILCMMLQIQPSLRPTAKECLTAAGASSVKLEKSLPPKVIDVLLEGGIESVLEFMQAFWDIEEVQAEAIQHLASFARDKSALPYLPAFTELITFAMKTHVDSLKLQVDGCSLLLEVLSHALEQDVVMALDENVTSCLLDTVRKHSENEELLSLVCTLLMMISASEVAAENLKKVGVIPDLLSILRNYLHNEKICFSCCGVLWSLAVSENNVDKALLKSAVPVTSAVLQEHLQNGTVTESACSALWALSLQGCLTENEYEPITALLLDALRKNPERPVLVKNACQALASLLRLSEISALRFITDSKGSGINLIEDAYHLHFDNPEVVETICMLINEMAQYDDVVLDMLSQKMEDLLSEIKIRFPSSMEIMTLVDATLLKLQK